MSFLTALGSYLGGRGEAKQRSYENALEQQRLKQESDYNAASLGIQRDEAAQAKIANQAKLRAQGIDPATGAYTPLTLPKSLQQVIPGNKGVQPKTDDPAYWSALAAHETQLAQAYRAAGRSEEADTHASNARDAALNSTSLANSTFTAGAKTQNEYSQTNLNNAKTLAELDLPKRAREIAKGHDEASIQRAATAAQAAWNRAVLTTGAANQRSELSNDTRMQVAQFQGKTRWAVAQLTGAYMLQGKNLDAATKIAIAHYNNQFKAYLQQTNPKYNLLGVGDPNDPQPDVPGNPNAPVVNNYIGGGFPVPSMQPLAIPGGLPGFTPPVPGATPVTNALRKATGAPPATTGSRVDPTQALSRAAALLHQGTSPQAIRAALEDYVKQGRMDAAVARQIETQLRLGGAGALAPLPVGGSQTNRPF